MSVLYRFKNAKDYEAVKFDGALISAADLKAIIVQQKKIVNSEIQVENEQTNQIYADDDQIQKNTSIIVSRLPFANSNKRIRTAAGQQHGGHNSHHNNHHHHNSNYHNNHHHHNHHNNNNNHQSSSSSASMLDGGGINGGGREALELVSTKDMTEEEKIKYIQNQSTKDFDPSRYARGRGGHRPGGRGPHFVRPGYTCRKCHIPGHSIYDCRMSNVHKVKRSSGIPRDFLMKVDSKEKGALMTPSGEYAVPFIDREAYSNPKVEKAPFFEDGTPSDTIPQ